MHKNALFKGCSTHVAMETIAVVRGLGPRFHTKSLQKRVKCLFLYLKLSTILQIGTSTIHSDITHLHFRTFNFSWVLLSRYSFGHFCCRVKQWKRLSEFLQKYTGSGTEITQLAGYNIQVFKYVKISVGLPLLSIRIIYFFTVPSAILEMQLRTCEYEAGVDSC